MTRRQFWAVMVAMTLACVLALFLFPLPHGSYSATHGPTSELRALQWVGLLLLWVTGWALSRFAGVRLLSPDTRRIAVASIPAAPSAFAATSLRC